MLPPGLFIADFLSFCFAELNAVKMHSQIDNRVDYKYFCPLEAYNSLTPRWLSGWNPQTRVLDFKCSIVKIADLKQKTIWLKEKKLKNFSWATKKRSSKIKKEKGNSSPTCQIRFYTVSQFRVSVKWLFFWMSDSCARMDKNLPWNKFLSHSSVMKSNMVHAWWLSYLSQLGDKIIRLGPRLLRVKINLLIHNFRLSSSLIFRQFRPPLRNWNKW